MATNFDYIIVGGGTSGSVIANRLVSQTEASVLVIEAGRDSGGAPDVLIPGKYVYQLEQDKEGLWELPTRPQKNLKGRALTFLRGKQLGGSSAVNYMAMARGPAADYDEWAKMTGDDGWKWDNVLPLMNGMEDFCAEAPAGFQCLANIDPAHHGTGGPIKLGFGKEMTPGVETFVEACQEIGINICRDINSGNPVGVGLAQFNVRDGVRSYAANAFLDHGFRSQHSNLHILTHATVRRLVMDGNRIRGVVVSKSGSGAETEILCNQKVILCAGTFATPQVLMSTGIGPKEMVEAVGLESKLDVPGIGQGMLDHSILTLEYRITDPAVDHCRLFADSALLTAAETQYEKDRSGPLSVFGSSGSVAFPKIERLLQSDEFQALDNETQAFLRHPERPSAEIWLGSGYAAYTGEVEHGQSFMTYELLLQNNLSRGTVELQQIKNDVMLDIDPKFLEHPYDRRIAIETVRTALDLSRTQAYSGVIEQMVHGPRGDDDASILDFVKDNLGQGYHSVGTCKMGPRQDAMSVVDIRFDVLGIQDLKIADLSVCPILTCNHTQINAYLIGERCAQVLLDEWRSLQYF